MRAVVVHPGPAFSVADVANGWDKALRQLGVDVVPFSMGDAMTFCEAGLRATGQLDTDGQQAARLANGFLRQTVYDAWPDLILIVSAFFVTPDTYRILRSRGHKIAALFTESPYEDDNQADIAPFVDLAVVNDPTNLDQFRAKNERTYYLPHAYDPDLHHPGPAKPGYESDFAFVGTGYPERIEFFEACDFTGIDATFAGNWSDLRDGSPLVPHMAHELGACCPNDETVELYRGTKASANIYRTSSQRPGLSDGWAMGPREVELAASGTFFLTEQRGENAAVLPMVPTFDGPGEFSEQLRWWLDRPEARDNVVMKAREAVADRTFTANAGQLLTLAGF